MRTAAVLPVKRFDRAKQRLADSVGVTQRAALAEAMVGDVLDALSQTRSLDAVVVVSAESRAAALAVRVGAEVVADREERGQSAAVQLGLTRVARLGHSRALLVPGDCPALSPAELDALLADPPPAPAVVVVPDRHGTGTNALLLSPVDAIAPAFGAGSFVRHMQRADAAGATCAVARPSSLLLDVDTREDLETLRATLDRHADGAPRTRVALETITLPARAR